MVTIKGKKISNKKARESIKGMKELIYHYQHPFEKTLVFDRCPICGDCDSGDCDCGTCPWILLTGNNCRGNYHWQVVQSLRRRQNRIKQLRRWIKVYERALEA